MGCKAITPHLVSLAKRLEDKPFHLLAAHSQKGEKADVLSYLLSKGFDPTSPNMTVSSFGGHPNVKGNGYVPYYLVFDHTGKLVRHHMCGNYHGGDGLGMIEWVDRMLEKAPDIYLGEEPFPLFPALAKKVADKKGFPATVLELESQLKGDLKAAAAAELERLLDGVQRHRDTGLARIERQLASKPGGVLKSLSALAAEFGKSALAEPLQERLTSLKSSDVLKRSIVVEKALAKLTKRVAKMKPCSACKRTHGAKSLRASCATCRSENAGSLKKTAKKADDLTTQAGDLPIAATVEAFADTLR